MVIDAAILIALGGVITAAIAIFPAFSAYLQSRANAKKIETETRFAARKDEITSLREEVARLAGRVDELSKANVQLQGENNRLHAQVIALRAENAWLRTQLRQSGIEIPPLPPEIRELTADLSKPNDGANNDT
jgi:chromosome segregation ATPase